MTDEALLEALHRALGSERVLVDGSDTERYLIDERRRFEGRALAVVQPGSVDEVCTVVAACAAAGHPVVPQGGNTGLCGGATAPGDGASVVLSLERLRAIRGVDPENFTITVDAGVTVSGVAEAAAAADRLFPLRFGADGTAQLGGALSTNAGGMAVLRYGSARDLTLGVEAVLADGRVFSDLGGLRKDNTGYSLSDLFVGAEGTLGIITGATLKLHPVPAERATALVAASSVGAAVGLLAELREATDDRIVAFEWMGRGALGLLEGTRPLSAFDDNLVLLEATTGQIGGNLEEVVGDVLGKALAAGGAHDATIAGSAAQQATFWALRDDIPEAEKRAGGSLKHDVAVAVSDVAELLDRAGEAVVAVTPDVTISAFGHLGDGNIHFNVLGCPAEDEVRVTAAVFDVVDALGGSFSAEHGIGRLRRDELARRKPGVDLDLMRAIKSALDPDGIMNPGAVL